MQNMGQITSPPFQPISQISTKPTNTNLVQNPPYQSGGADFNTMQNLFATQNQTIQINQNPVTPPTLNTNFPQQGQSYKN
jgi:hypothetical protein